MGEELLEREVELASLDALLAGAMAGRGGVAIVEGEAGLGKSRLLASARARAEAAGMQALAARGSELERAFAFGVARQLLERRPWGSAPAAGWRSGPDGGTGTPSSLEVIQSLHHALIELVSGASGTSGGGAVLITIDDAQWADEPSLRFLAHLALRLDELPIAVVLGMRTGEPDVPADVLAGLRASPNAVVLQPRELSERAVGVMVRRMLGEVEPALIEACARASAGNPFYLQELLRTLVAEPRPSPEHVRAVAPPAVLRSVMVRLGRLGRAATAMARAVAVLGDGTSLRLAAALAGVEVGEAEAAADALASASILAAGEPLHFLHPLIASALESDMGSFERARSHRHAADLLRAEGAAEERVAAHLLLARPEGDQETVSLLETAARRALAAGHPDAADRLLARALIEPPAPDRRADVLLLLAKAEAMSGASRATGHLNDAIEEIEAGPRRAEALADLATLHHHTGDFRRAVELARRAGAELPPDDGRQQRLLAIELGAETLQPEAPEELARRMEAVVAQVRAGSPPTDPALLALTVGWMGIAAPPAEVRALAERAIAIDPLIDDSHGASMGWIGSALVWTDALELSERWLASATATARRRGDIMAEAVAALQAAWVHHHRGQLDLAAADAERALEIYPYGWTWTAWTLAATRLARGDLAAARRVITRAERAGSGAPDYGLLLEVKARLELAEGNAAAAFETAVAVADHADQRFGQHQPRLWEWRRLAAGAALRLGNGEEAWRLVEPDLTVLRSVGPARQLGAALTVAGMIAGGGDGLDLLAEAATVVASSPSRMQRAESVLEYGSALRRAGKRAAAKEQLGAALELASEMGALLIERRARNEMQALGLRPRRAARSGVGSLTPTERRVAELTATGLTTPKIADELHVSRHTVETHLGHIYRKLGLSSRSELPEALAGTAPAG